jgi:tetratricopeptide (TPR) repeat protein
MDHPYLEAIRRDFPQIRPYQEDDFEWRNEGMDLLQAGQIVQAERKFKQLLLSQPEHWDGAEGLAMVYHRIGDKPRALFFVQRALRLAEESFRKDEVDPEVIDLLKAFVARVQAMPE